ncbi:hypothetical protein PR202_gb17184 [Eleusine coracana subsp. coracana]|uniref:PGG domain-containing protein n=1 Tax=Eleusine coracana subsp. coracana TaxID=191504 RepID=A0AAV5F293_ELECO|nr:hypothetical protein QOZ80_6BG0469520 [Eleusine coracana subsp. coracana]GJN28999.1 hypothetical protein PR202_gb17184 [Eleusine coracana subsp. coracana]
MSQQQINEAPPQEAASAASAPQEAASDAEADAVITKISGEEWGIKLRITPVQSQQGDGQSSGATAQEVNLSFKGILRILDDDGAEAQRRKWFKEMRGWLMVLTTVAASVTYQAGLNPPGGFWQDDPKNKSHHAGDPALHDEHHSRYMIFYYFNATAFVTSLVIMVLLMSERFYHTEGKVLALLLATIVDLASLIGAYIAGTT